MPEYVHFKRLRDLLTLIVFSKLASKLTLDKMAELIIIPLIFIAQTLISFACAWLVSRLFGFKKRPRNFVIAMGVFGNSNSLPISLVLSLANTISGLHWDRIPGDNDTEVAARGILYLMIFQQLGQLMRWTWGYNVLLKPAKHYTPEEGGLQPVLEATDRYLDEPEEADHLISNSWATTRSSTAYDSGSASPTDGHSDHLVEGPKPRGTAQQAIVATPMQGGFRPFVDPNSWSHPRPEAETNGTGSSRKKRPSLISRTTEYSQQKVTTLKDFGHRALRPIFEALPTSMQKVLDYLWQRLSKMCLAIWAFMNPPLWAMLAAIVVASVPALQKLFFTDGTFINNSVTSAIEQSAGVAVPLILVVLGANLARSTHPKDVYDSDDEENLPPPDEQQLEGRLVVASLLSRMLLPLLVMAPLLALTAKFVPVSILDDPIFIIVCFLLTGAPSALQLAQICQIHNVYMGAISRLLFQSYVVWILPSTLILVTCALKVVEWATQ